MGHTSFISEIEEKD